MKDHSDKDPWETFADYDFSDPDEKRQACLDSLKGLRAQMIQAAASTVGVYEQGADRARLTELLADELVFSGPIGDDALYIRRDGNSIPLSDLD
mgnify:CR=1 FL=1